MPRQVKASRTAAMVVRSLWVALGVVWVMGLLLGWDVDRLVVCWPVSWDVVVAVDIGTWNLLGESVEGPAAKTADRPVAAAGLDGERGVAYSHAIPNRERGNSVW